MEDLKKGFGFSILLLILFVLPDGFGKTKHWGQVLTFDKLSVRSKKSFFTISWPALFELNFLEFFIM